MSTEAKQEATFDTSPQGWAKRWGAELSAAKGELEKWHEQGRKADKAYRDERDEAASTSGTGKRWNLFWSAETVLQALLYGNTPKVDVSRRFADSKDDAARVAAEMLERMLNADIERSSDTYAEALQFALQDRLIPGWGVVRVRYVADFEDVAEQPAKLHPETGAELAPAVPATQSKSREDVETDYVFWRDMRWSKARVWHELRWMSFLAQMSRPELVKRFGPTIGNAVPLNTKKRDSEEEAKADPLDRADVWEIWDKETKTVYWYVEGYGTILDSKPDPLELEGFWPCPRPMAANLTNTKLIPKPDYTMAVDLYESVNDLTTRIDLLQKAVRVVGMYDKANLELARMLSETKANQMIAVSSWAVFGEKGGVKGAVDWFPLEQVVNALGVLREQRQGEIDALYQVTGMSDIMRGQATGPGVTATEQGIKAKFGSVRVQALQDEFARFASDVQKLKAEIIAKHFEPATILERSNAQFAFEPGLAQQAVQLIKSQASTYRVEVKPEAVSLTDFAALKQERTEVMAAIGQFMTSVAPIATAIPNSMPFLLEMLQALVAGLKGSSTMEGILDTAITAAKQQAAQAAANPQPPPPHPKVQAQQLKMQGDQMKAQTDMQAGQFKLQADLTKIQAETQAHASQEQAQAEWNTRESAQKALIQHNFKAMDAKLNPPKPGGAP